jgi:hypothetical protein
VHFFSDFHYLLFTMDFGALYMLGSVEGDVIKIEDDLSIEVDPKGSLAHVLFEVGPPISDVPKLHFLDFQSGMKEYARLQKKSTTKECTTSKVPNLSSLVQAESMKD